MDGRSGKSQRSESVTGIAGDGRFDIDRRQFLSTSAGVSVLSIAGCIGAAIKGGATDEEHPRFVTPTTTSQTERPTPVSTPTERPYRTGLGEDTFERLEGIEVVDGEMQLNDSRNVTGTQCVEFHDPTSDGAWLHVPLREPVDFANARLSCYLATDGPGATNLPYVFLWDIDGNAFLLRGVVRSDERLIRTDFGVLGHRDADSPADLNRIDQVSFRIGSTDESGVQNAYLDYPTRVEVPDTPSVVFMFDDGNETDYTEAFPYLSQYDYPAITYVNTDIINDEGRLSEDQLADLASGGWLIGSHTASHENLSALSDTDAIRRQVAEAKQWLVERGYTEGAHHFCYPYGGVDEQALEIVSQFHRTGRVSGIQPIALPSNPQLIPGEGDPELPEVNALLDRAVQFGGVVCLFFHNLEEEYRVEFHRIVDEIHRRDQAGDLQVVRFDELEAMAEDAAVSE